MVGWLVWEWHVCANSQSYREFQNDGVVVCQLGEISKLDKGNDEIILKAALSVLLAAIWLTVQESMKYALNV